MSREATGEASAVRQAWLARAITRVPVAFVGLNDDWRVMAANDAALDRLHVTEDALVGHDLWTALPGLAGTPVEELCRRVAATRTEGSTRIRLPDEPRWFDVDAMPVSGGLLVRFLDATARQQLERLARRDSLILASVSEGIYGLDADGRTTFINPAAERMLGYALSELLGADQHEVIHHSYADGSPYPREECAIHRALTSGVVQRSSEEVFWRKDRTALPVELVATPIIEDGAVSGAVITFSDISERQRAEHYRRQAYDLAAQQSAHQQALLELQEALQPPAPGVTEPQLGVCYLPAPGAAAGGDVYDWQLLPDGQVHLAVADVLGKGVGAAKDAIAVMHALRLLVLADIPLANVIRQADSLLGRAFPDLVATSVIGRYRPDTGRLLIADGGHPPPLLMHPDGSSQYLESEGRPIGWPEAGSEGVLETTVPPGGTVVFYTDGLVEGKRDIVRGLRNLAQLAGELRGLPPRSLAEALVSRVTERADHRDDTLCVVLHRGS